MTIKFMTKNKQRQDCFIGEINDYNSNIYSWLKTNCNVELKCNKPTTLSTDKLKKLFIYLLKLKSELKDDEVKPNLVALAKSRLTNDIRIFPFQNKAIVEAVNVMWDILQRYRYYEVKAVIG